MHSPGSRMQPAVKRRRGDVIWCQITHVDKGDLVPLGGQFRDQAGHGIIIRIDTVCTRLRLLADANGRQGSDEDGQGGIAGGQAEQKGAQILQHRWHAIGRAVICSGDQQHGVGFRSGHNIVVDAVELIERPVAVTLVIPIDHAGGSVGRGTDEVDLHIECRQLFQHKLPISAAFGIGRARDHSIGNRIAQRQYRQQLVSMAGSQIGDDSTGRSAVSDCVRTGTADESVRTAAVIEHRHSIFSPWQSCSPA